MALLERIADMLGGMNGELVRSNMASLTELRLRVGRAARFDLLDGRELKGEPLDGQAFQAIMNFLVDNSLYSRENELKQGYFTTREGFRVGICGKVNAGKTGVEHLANIGSACIRIPREIPGAADEILRFAEENKRYSVLIVSPPGLGKTTILRDYIRSLSERGLNIGLADERREIACCLEGVPQLDVGCRTDVLDGCPKALALSMMIRSCAPDLVAADEIGSAEDAEAIFDARRCGVHVAATAHGGNLRDVSARYHVGRLLQEKVFDFCVLLGSQRGQVREIIPLNETANERICDAQGNSACVDFTFQHLRGTNVFKCSQAQV